MTKDFVKEFYNEYYNKDRGYNDNNSFEGFLYKTLKKYESSRWKVVADCVNKLHNIEEKKILDLGCGQGDFLKCLKNTKHLYGLDIAGVRLQKIVGNTYTVIEGDLDQRFPFDDGFFDVVTSMAVLEHVFSVEHHLQETHRILRKGGYFFLEIPNVAFLPNRLRLLFGNTPITGDWAEAWDDNHLHYFTRSDLKKYIEKFGFEVEKITGAGIFASLRNWWPSLFCGDLIYICKKK